ncbi:MAG TPA: hypothetical protein VFK86_14305 [Bauldia sp.]|nr:hypothetical protein [Bauldia sp.]
MKFATASRAAARAEHDFEGYVDGPPTTGTLMMAALINITPKALISPSRFSSRISKPGTKGK